MPQSVSVLIHQLYQEERLNSNLSCSFEGLIFFVYDREAVKKEADPPENAIVYFYPPSVMNSFVLFSCFEHTFPTLIVQGFLELYRISSYFFKRNPHNNTQDSLL